MQITVDISDNHLDTINGALHDAVFSYLFDNFYRTEDFEDLGISGFIEMQNFLDEVASSVISGKIKRLQTLENIVKNGIKQIKSKSA